MKYKITPFDRILHNSKTTLQDRLQSLEDRMKRGKDALPHAWRRVIYVYHAGKLYDEAIISLNNLMINIMWNDIMHQYLLGYDIAEDKQSYQFIWHDVLVSPEASDTIYNIIKGEISSFIETQTRTYQVLREYLVENGISWGPQPSKYWHNKTIAYCSLHKMNLTYWKATQTHDCFHRNGKNGSCNNLVIVNNTNHNGSNFYRTPAGLQLLATSSISQRVRYRKN